MNPAAAISLSGITKRFGSVPALDSVDFALRSGRIHALLGENGAGKSTLMGVLFGLTRPDAGVLEIGGTAVAWQSPRDAIRAGIGMVQQHFSHVPALTVTENVALGGSGRFEIGRSAAEVKRVATQAGLDLDPLARVADLSVEAQQRLEIVRALAHGARILILDEPTAVLAPGEATELLGWLRRFADSGGTVALVTHKVREALAIADDVTVLRAGRRVASGLVKAFTPDSLAQAMFPEKQVSDPARRGERDPGAVIVSAERVSVRGAPGEAGIVDATFELRAGEVVGVAALERSGHATLLRALAGLQPPSSGRLSLPAEISFVPGDRHRDALVLEFSLYENLALRHVGARRGLMRWRDVRVRTSRVLEQFHVRAVSGSSRARALSGGNQQRFVLARELDAHPTLLVAENPTRGLDLAAAAAIRDRLADAAHAGAAIVVYSSDVDEVLELAHRVLVVHHGVVREVPVARELVAQAMVGVA